MKDNGLVRRFALRSLVLLLVVGALLFATLFDYLRIDAIRSAAEDAVGDVAVLTPLLLPYLTGQGGSDSQAGTPRAYPLQAAVTLHETVARLRAPDVLRVNVWRPDGFVLYSDDPSLAGKRFEVEPDLAQALKGEVVYRFKALEGQDADTRNTDGAPLLEVYAPIRAADGSVVGAYELYKSWQVFARHWRALSTWLLAGLVAGLAIVYFGLLSLFRAASRRLVRQASELEQLSVRLRRALEASERLMRATIASLSDAVEAKDAYTAGHASRVARIATALGQALALGPDELRDLELAALLHDIGKIGVPDSILLKPGALTEEEWQLVRRHPTTGAHIVGRVPGLERVALAVAQSHEHWDGSGYPEGLRSDAICRLARIILVADAYDALTTDRPYRRACSHEEACEELQRCAGHEFAPEVVQAFLAHQQEIQRAAREVDLEPRHGEHGRIGAEPGVVEAPVNRALARAGR